MCVLPETIGRELQLTICFFQGSFPKSKFSFKVYVPAIRTIEDSQISDKDD